MSRTCTPGNVALGQLDTKAAGVLVNEGGMEGDEVVERHLKVTSGGAQQGKDPGSKILFFGTADLSGRCKTRQDGKLTDEVVSCKKRRAGALAASNEVSPGQSTLPAAFAPRIHQLQQRQPHQQSN